MKKIYLSHVGKPMQTVKRKKIADAAIFCNYFNAVFFQLYLIRLFAGSGAVGSGGLYKNVHFH